MVDKKRKSLIFDVDRCTGCRECELVCSFKHESKFNPKKARIRVVRLYPTPGIDFAFICQHCEEPPCAKVCPQGAIGRDTRSGAITISKKQCFGCGLCIDACPFGTIYFDTETEKAYKCDLCKGDPECVQYCAHGALTFAEVISETGVNYKHIYTKNYSKVRKEVNLLSNQKGEQI
jgi:Fe-S-cluster-containing hydrogenase component 2